MNSCTSSFERGSRPVVGSSSSSSTGEVSSARASATFCCIPRERFSIGSPRRSAGKPTRAEDLGDPPRVSAWRQPVEAGRVGEVLLGAHPLEEARLDRDAVDEPPDGARRSREDVVAEDARRAPVVQQQRREQADERRLAGAVLAEHGDALAAGDRQARRRPAPARAGAREAAVAAHAPAELLAEAARLDGGDGRRTTGVVRKTSGAPWRS